MSNPGQTMEIDSSRFRWYGTEGYPDNYDFGLSEEEVDAFNRKCSAEAAQIGQELEEFFDASSLALAGEPETLSTKAQSLGKRYALHMCRYGLLSYGHSIDVETWSEASVIETERWWSALEKAYTGDWSYLIGELYEEGETSINASRRIGYGVDMAPEDGDPAHEFQNELANAIADHMPGAFDMSDSWYKTGRSLMNLANILAEAHLSRDI